ncbi:MAG: excinuclease ABC subunit A [Proteobacteria bacterium]|nr:MAG: excinuclease ABC subunit A [Pseudomonadota bacterium]
MLCTNSAEARNDLHDFSIKSALSSPVAKQKVQPNIHLYFGNQKYPRIQKSFGKFSTSKKTNAFNKSDQQACERAFLSAVLQLQRKARNLGANAIINIKSNYNRIETSSRKKFKCAAGNIIAGVALKGTFVKTKGH